MKTIRSIITLVMALCLALSVCCALADQTLEGDANVGEFRDALVVDAEPHELIVKLL